MSKILTVNKTTDMIQTELDKVQKYIEDGLPGITEITNNELYRMYDLYLNGSTYTQIAASLGLKKVIVLYLAHHNKWYESKSEGLNEIMEKTKGRVQETKLRSSEFMLLMVQAYQKRIANKFTRYLATNDEENMDEVDLKELSQLMKAIEMVNELDDHGRNAKGKNPTLGLNIGGGVTVKRENANEVTITPKDMTIGETLRQFAESKLEEEKRRSEIQSNDIGNQEGENDA
jgi:hypothetical protein